MLRESVRAFLAAKAPLASVRAGYDRPAARPGGVGRARRARRDRAARAEEHGGAGMGMVDAAVVLEELGRAVCPRRTRRPRSARSSLADAELLPRLADGSTIGTVAIFEPGARYRWTTPATGRPARRRRRRLAPRRRRRCTSPTRARPTSCSSPRSTTTASSASSRPSDFDVETRPTVDGSRKQATDRARRARPRGASTPATRRTLVARTLDRHRRRGRGRRRGRRAARARARGRVREGTRAVRQADRRVPGGAAPLRRHAAHGRARPGRGLLRVLGARRRVTRGGAPRRHVGAARSPPTRSRSSAAPRSRCSAASASRGSTTSTCTTSACSRVGDALGTASDHLEELATLAIG